MSIDAVWDPALVERERKLEADLKEAAGGALTYVFDGVKMTSCK